MLSKSTEPGDRASTYSYATTWNLEDCEKRGVREGSKIGKEEEMETDDIGVEKGEYGIHVHHTWNTGHGCS